jgi:hypothetical protein
MAQGMVGMGGSFMTDQASALQAATATASRGPG